MPVNPLVYEFKPNQKRFFGLVLTRYLVIYTLTGVIITAIQQRFSWTTLGFLWLLALLSSMFAAIQNISVLSLSFSNGAISGFSPYRQRRVSIPVSQIDKMKSCRRGLVQITRGSTYIFSKDGERIILSLYAFEPRQMRSILALTGCSSSQSATEPG
ncbi:MAG: hypothetical protein EHM70_16085 [Chloroflexota bacterium]|nr:MAG: hypothetical protein EHM70_16085 [Chloroflexota bacterium]